MPNEKAAEGNGGRAIQIADWKPYIKNTLRGFFSATLPSGLIIHGLTVHERGGDRWIAFPAREWTDSKNQKQFTRIIELADRPTTDAFNRAVLRALDQYLAELPK